MNALNKFKKVCLEISERLSNLPYDDGDGSDIGNEVGIIIQTSEMYVFQIGFHMHHTSIMIALQPLCSV